MEWFGDKIVASVDMRLKKELVVAAEMVLTKSKEQTPHDTGALVGSAHRKTLNGGKTQELSFNTPYAHRQHEDLAYKHPVGNAKYLETPLRENAEAVLKMLNDASGLGLKGG